MNLLTNMLKKITGRCIKSHQIVYLSVHFIVLQSCMGPKTSTIQNGAMDFCYSRLWKLQWEGYRFHSMTNTHKLKHFFKRRETETKQLRKKYVAC